MRAGIETLAPALLCLDPGDIDHLNAVMDVTLPGHPYMKSAIDIAAGTSSARRRACLSGNVLGGTGGCGENATFDVNRAWQPATAINVPNCVASRDWVERPCETLA